MARTAAVIQAEITRVEETIKNIELAGQSYEITSGSGAGTKRVVTMPDYDKLTKRLDKLYGELAEVNKTRAVRLGIGW